MPLPLLPLLNVAAPTLPFVNTAPQLVFDPGGGEFAALPVSCPTGPATVSVVEHEGVVVAVVLRWSEAKVTSLSFTKVKADASDGVDALFGPDADPDAQADASQDYSVGFHWRTGVLGFVEEGDAWSQEAAQQALEDAHQAQFAPNFVVNNFWKYDRQRVGIQGVRVVGDHIALVAPCEQSSPVYPLVMHAKNAVVGVALLTNNCAVTFPCKGVVG